MTLRRQCDEGLWETLRTQRLDTLAGAWAYGGGVDLVKAGLGQRRRTRLEIVDGLGREHCLYMKRYGPERWTQRLRRCLTYGWRKSPAGVEFDQIMAVRQSGVPTMHALVADEELGWFDAKRSYLIVDEVPGEALERCFEAICADGDHDLLETITLRLAILATTFHRAGLAHRDFYAAHIFLNQTDDGPELYLIDLARVFSPLPVRRFRWWVKDIAQLKYSMPAAWVERYWPTFLEAYWSGLQDRRSLTCWDRVINRRVRSMQRRHRRKATRERGGQ